MRNFLSKIGKVLFVIFSLSTMISNAQTIGGGQIHGNFQMDAQYYIEDSLIGAPDVPEKLLMNGFGNIIYTNGNFNAGFRYESYQNSLLGYPAYKGNGIPYRFASYTNEDLQITVGNFYDQFGSGMIFRTYEERNLGYDNAMDGFRIKYKPYKGIELKGVIGTQRNFFDKGEGIVRGVDGEFFINDLFGLDNIKTKYTLGGSFVSKYQKKGTEPLYKLPENVGAYAGRLNITRSGFGLMGEYAYKINDPNASNGMIYKNGEGLFLSTSYSQKGMGIILSAKRIDNMDFRSDRNASLNSLIINYLPALTKQHTYTLMAMYPYATQPNGEYGYEGTVMYNIKKGSILGGKYGTKIAVNYSLATAIDKQQINDTIAIGTAGTLGYKSDYLKMDGDVFFEDFNIEFNKKFSKTFKMILTYAYITYNKEVIEFHPTAPKVYSNIVIADLAYSFNPTNTLRAELQSLMTKQDEGNWAMCLLEYTIAPKWFFTVADLYNYGNEESEKRIHYYNAGFGFTKGANRIALSYGKQRQGITCSGGICRAVPASNGVLLTITSSF